MDSLRLHGGRLACLGLVCVGRVDLRWRCRQLDANRGCGVGHLFLSIDAHLSSDSAQNRAKHDDLEAQELTALTTAELERALLVDKSILVHSWSSTMSLALLHWERLRKNFASSSS